MRNIILSILVTVLLAGCAAKTNVATNTGNIEPTIKKYVVVVKGLEAEYAQDVINSLTHVKGYAKHTVPMNREYDLEIICNYYDTPALYDDIMKSLNNVFMVLSKTVNISTVSNSFQVKVINY